MLKTKAMKLHAKRRLSQRHGNKDLDNDFLIKLVKRIQSGELSLVEKQSNTRSIFFVPELGARAVYDRKRKVIVTVLSD